MGADCGFTRSSCGYVGRSDGYQNILKDMQMSWQFGQALDGNIAVMGEIDVAQHREFTIALSFGDGHHSAIAQLMQTLATPYAEHRDRFILQWARSSFPVGLGAAATDGGTLMRISQNVLLIHEDKSYSGAFIASASIPWGASKGDTDLGGYHLVWTRDMVETATALLACGRTDTALRALVYLACTQRPDGSFAQNFWIDGTPYWTGMQLDEVAFPIILAWRLWKQDGLGSFDVFPFVERAAGFLVPVCSGDPAGALGGVGGLFAFDAGGCDRRTDLRGRYCAVSRLRPMSLRNFSNRMRTGSKRIWMSGRLRPKAYCIPM